MLTVSEAFTHVRGSIQRGQIGGGLNLLHEIRIREVSVQLLQCLLNTEKGWEETIKHSSLQISTLISTTPNNFSTYR